MTTQSPPKTSDHPAVVQARAAADAAREALRQHARQIDALQRRTWEFEDACRQANEAVVVAERRARQENG